MGPALRPIGAVATELGVAAHVLRFWETRFPQVQPLTRAGGRRYYRASDVALLRAIARLSRDSGMTLGGIEKLISSKGPARIAAEHGGAEAVVATDWYTRIAAARDRLAAALEAYRAV